MTNEILIDNVRRIEHEMIKDMILWERMDDDRLCHSITAYICGMNDLAEKIIEFLTQEEEYD